jgi:hypothetical protein
VILQGTIPPSNSANKKGQHRGDQLIPPRPALSREETGSFLEFLFCNIARKLKQLKLKETARVARYLKALAWEAQPSSERDTVEHLATVIWMPCCNRDRRHSRSTSLLFSGSKASYN